LRLEKPTEGQILLEGRDIQSFTGPDLQEYRTLVQAVFQDPWSSLSPRMRVRDIVAEPLVVNRKVMPQERDERVAEVLNQVGLHPEQSNNYPHEFSGGQRQRIAVASALVSYPKLIVLDEPVSALDVSIRAQVMNLLKDLQEQYNVSYLQIAHNLATVRYMAHQTAVMYLGADRRVRRNRGAIPEPAASLYQGSVLGSLTLTPRLDTGRHCADRGSALAHQPSQGLSLPPPVSFCHGPVLSGNPCGEGSISWAPGVLPSVLSRKLINPVQ
jgi:ABC-type glutathione transport system ATPase component